MAWRRSLDRRCLRRCPASESWRTRRSTTSSSEALTFTKRSFQYKCNNIFSVHITISCQMNFDDYPLDAHACQFQVGSCKFSIHQSVCLKWSFRLWHRGGGDVQGSLYLRCSQTAKFTAPHTDRGAPESFQNSSTSFRSEARRTKNHSCVKCVLLFLLGI